MDFASPISRRAFVGLAVALLVGSLVAAVAAGPAWPFPVFATQLDGLDNRFLALLSLGVALAMALAPIANGSPAACRRRLRIGLMLAYALSTALFGALALLGMAVVEVAISVLVASIDRKPAP